MRLPDKNLPWPIVWAGVVEIARSEGCRLTAYQDVVGVWTIGWGQTDGVESGLAWSQSKADQDLLRTLTILARNVRVCCEIEPYANELAAMVSLAYNIGMGWPGTVRPAGARNGFRQSSVLRAHNRGDHGEAGRAFGLWNKAKGQVITGLVARRAREAALYLTPDDESAATPASAAVPRDARQAETVSDYFAAGSSPDADPESTLRQSPIAQSGVVSIATGALAAAGGISEQAREIAERLGIEPLLVVAAVAMTVGAVVLYQRVRQRREGWA